MKFHTVATRTFVDLRSLGANPFYRFLWRDGGSFASHCWPWPNGDEHEGARWKP